MYNLNYFYDSHFYLVYCLYFSSRHELTGQPHELDYVD
jgi:hypothetical protein